MDIVSSYDGTYYRVRMDDDEIFQTKDRYEHSMFMAELKGRLKQNDQIKSLQQERDKYREVLSAILEKLSLMASGMIADREKQTIKVNVVDLVNDLYKVANIVQSALKEET